MNQIVKAPLSHDALVVGADSYDLQHLKGFSVSMPGKGIKSGSDLSFVVAFSSHVYSERSKHGETHHLLDHHGIRRTFDLDRYVMSKNLPRKIRDEICSDALTFISRSYGGDHNLIILDEDNGKTWTIVFCFYPIEIKGTIEGVRMEILSLHPKEIHQNKVKRKNISYFARKCLFDEARTPS
ncbi:hypothetical protein [Donghicola eburneus]|uniref:Uncharacterized protein n=1 Tax=Donghicola eburneus TaxID=393278 RepID=A0A1M4N1J1_9RHOB|nr:hypothetical protein [Donghicola eburneus]SCM68730.1 hypothetical protein KARMA_2957 [Donghicola eburneus]